MILNYDIESDCAIENKELHGFCTNASVAMNAAAHNILINFSIFLALDGTSFCCFQFFCIAKPILVPRLYDSTTRKHSYVVIADIAKMYSHKFRVTN